MCPACGGELRSGEALAQLAAEATSRGLPFAEVVVAHREARFARSRAKYEAEAERRRALDGRWDHRPSGDHGQAHLFILVGIALPSAGILGVVLVGTFLLLGLPAWIPVAGALVGVLGGWPLYRAVWVGVRSVLDRLASRRTWFDRHGEGVFESLTLVTLLLPTALTIGTSFILLSVVE